MHWLKKLHFLHPDGYALIYSETVLSSLLSECIYDLFISTRPKPVLSVGMSEKG